jgi:hypothetical protein
MGPFGKSVLIDRNFLSKTPVFRSVGYLRPPGRGVKYVKIDKKGSVIPVLSISKAG